MSVLTFFCRFEMPISFKPFFFAFLPSLPPPPPPVLTSRGGKLQGVQRGEEKSNKKEILFPILFSSLGGKKAHVGSKTYFPFRSIFSSYFFAYAAPPTQENITRYTVGTFKRVNIPSSSRLFPKFKKGIFPLSKTRVVSVAILISRVERKTEKRERGAAFDMAHMVKSFSVSARQTD